MSNQPASSPAAVDSSTDKRRSFGRYVKRLSSVLRRGSSKNAMPGSSSTAQSAAASATPVTTTTAAIAPIAETIDELPIPQPQLVSTSASPSTVPGAYAKSAIQQERARALFAKYGLTLEAHEWVATATTTHVQRVEKPIRMRVHRTCHKCETSFGLDRSCKNCEHRRCKKCPRYPPKKDRTDRPTEIEDIQMQTADAIGELKKRRKSSTPYLTITSKSGGELVYAPTRQRIHRTCHKCHTHFQPVTAAVCHHCQHSRCTKCPREPAKSKKWPEGYPGDAPYESSEEEMPTINRTWKRPRQRIRWTCCCCESLFTTGSRTCTCSHERCETCTRQPPKKPKKEFDPEIVKSVEEKLERFRIERTAGTTSLPSFT
ncbi:hypothetical protein EJ05DRAFT_139751 [Pseudovirgaria hyperparasitica]|uniref:Uncharacterized protein n=1 Tax=Pseudovirgaria hyperparasitica TaxID=470096 RepID=A0A6A6VW46_9PEZI|nr:uncharacterized protein EJ05DRAFT_139751 [Pseudovirgaria hyperparasitica]KAF2754385.1 hypothetical protein EJ05DRAFT_139751 [Pseudovirgaria hyperparasitica]